MRAVSWLAVCSMLIVIQHVTTHQTTPNFIFKGQSCTVSSERSIMKGKFANGIDSGMIKGYSVSVGSWETEAPKSVCTNYSSIAPRIQGRWYKANDGMFWFEPNECKLKRFTGEEARSCLAGLSIGLIGDSITGYQVGYKSPHACSRGEVCAHGKVYISVHTLLAN